MHETAVGEEGAPRVTSLSPHGCGRFVTATSCERQQLRRRHEREACTPACQKCVRDDLGLLFQAVALERLSGLQLIGIAAEGVPHERQIQAPALLRLPYVG